MIETIQKLSRLIDEAVQIFESDASWEVKYDAIFGMKISRQIGEADFSLDWCDPDTSYEEDVTYYVEALRKFREELGSLGNES